VAELRVVFRTESYSTQQFFGRLKAEGMGGEGRCKDLVVLLKIYTRPEDAED
jgi:hypothetical protein